MSKSDIEWTDYSWNPVTGCSPTSPACANCYAARMAKRLAGRFGYPAAPHQFRVTMHPERLIEPSTWRKPRRVFVVSMGDLFHEDVKAQWLEHIFAAMVGAPQHTYLLLTKRIDRAKSWLGFWLARRTLPRLPDNWWIGVTAENQICAEWRIPPLLEIPAAVRFVSVEPMLRPVNLDEYLNPGHESGGPAGWMPDPGVDWVICGAETGPGKRLMRQQWALDLLGRCREAGVPFFFKKSSTGQPTLGGSIVRDFPQR